MACGPRRALPRVPRSPGVAAVPERLRSDAQYRDYRAPRRRLLAAGRASLSRGRRRPGLGRLLGDEPGVRNHCVQHPRGPHPLHPASRAPHVGARPAGVPLQLGGVSDRRGPVPGQRRPLGRILRRAPRHYPVALLHGLRHRLGHFHAPGRGSHRPPERGLGSRRERDVRHRQDHPAAGLRRVHACLRDRHLVDAPRDRVPAAGQPADLRQAHSGPCAANRRPSPAYYAAGRPVPRWRLHRRALRARRHQSRADRGGDPRGPEHDRLLLHGVDHRRGALPGRHEHGDLPHGRGRVRQRDAPGQLPRGAATHDAAAGAARRSDGAARACGPRPVRPPLCRVRHADPRTTGHRDAAQDADRAVPRRPAGAEPDQAGRRHPDRPVRPHTRARARADRNDGDSGGRRRGTGQ